MRIFKSQLRLHCDYILGVDFLKNLQPYANPPKILVILESITIREASMYDVTNSA
jgi:hypothetical protein